VVVAGGVKCSIGALAVGASVTVTISVTFGVTGAVYDTASVSADQINTSTQQGVAFGAPPAQGGDGPFPLWSYVGLALGFYWVGARRLRVWGVGCGRHYDFFSRSAVKPMGRRLGTGTFGCIS